MGRWGGVGGRARGDTMGTGGGGGGQEEEVKKMFGILSTEVSTLTKKAEQMKGRR